MEIASAKIGIAIRNDTSSEMISDTRSNPIRIRMRDDPIATRMSGDAVTTALSRGRQRSASSHLPLPHQRRQRRQPQ